MCERGEKFVVKRSAGMGWWIGQIVAGPNIPVRKMDGTEVLLHQIAVLNVEHPEHRGNSIVYAADGFSEFETVDDARIFLRSLGVIV